MRIPSVVCIAIVSASAACGAAQTAPSTSSDGLDLLQKVAQHYADAKSYSLAATEEMTQTGDYQRMWQKTLLTAAEEPGGRFHFEGQSEFGNAATVSDGKTVWVYHAEQRRYTVAPAPEPAPAKGAPMPLSEMGLYRARDLRESLAHFAERFKSARRLADADLVLDGRTLSCAVIEVDRADLKRPKGDGKFDETIWIDKNSNTLIKTAEHSTFTFSGISHEEEIKTLYPRTTLDGVLPENLFVFLPPAEAHQVKEFPPPGEESMGVTLIGDRVPELKLKAADGTVAPIESFRGKVVLIDLWATWCAPCVAALPAMAKLAQEGKDKGLVVVFIDRDDEASKAAAYLKEKGLALTNFHDGEGQVESLLGNSPMPRDLIVDQDGWVVGDGQWVTRNGDLDENGLRARLAELGPAFHNLAPKVPQEAPCIASK